MAPTRHGDNAPRSLDVGGKVLFSLVKDCV